MVATTLFSSHLVNYAMHLLLQQLASTVVIKSSVMCLLQILRLQCQCYKDKAV